MPGVEVAAIPAEQPEPLARAELVGKAATGSESATADSVRVAVGRRFGLELNAGG